MYVSNEEYELGRIISEAVWKKLKDAIKANIFVRVENDVLRVEINHEEDSNTFERTYTDVATNALYGTPIDYYVQDTIRAYRKYILNKYFYIE